MARDQRDGRNGDIESGDMSGCSNDIDYWYHVANVVVAVFVFGSLFIAAFVLFVYPNFEESSIRVDQLDVTLVSDSDGAHIVQCDFLFSIDRFVPISIGGDIEDTDIRWRGMVPLSDAYVVRNGGLFVLKEPASAGDEIEIVIRHGGSETAVTATLGAAT